MSDADVQRDLGKMGAQIEGLAKQLSTLTEELRRTNEKLDGVQRDLDMASGGWKTLVAVGAAAATVGGLIATFLPMFFNRS